MDFTNWRIWALRALSLTFLCGLIAGCGLGEVAQRYETASFDPAAVATFTTFHAGNCSRPFDDPNTAAISPPPFRGFGVSGVGDSGLLEPGDEHAIFKMHSAARFDLASVIPAEAGNPSLSATLRFRAIRTDRTERGDPCQAVDRVERATTIWDRTSDFESALSSAPFTTVPCTRSGDRFECNVSTAVQGWVGDSARFPNNGLVIHGPTRVPDACDTNIGPPGNRFECAARLSDIELEVQFLPPE